MCLFSGERNSGTAKRVYRFSQLQPSWKSYHASGHEATTLIPFEYGASPKVEEWMRRPGLNVVVCGDRERLSPRPINLFQLTDAIRSSDTMGFRSGVT